MPTVRNITDLLSRTLGVPVAGHAARLVRAGLLPHGKAPLDLDEAVTLALAVVASEDARGCIPALERLAGAELTIALYKHDAKILESLTTPGTWKQGSIEEMSCFGPVEVVLETLAANGKVSFTVEDGGWSADIEGAYLRAGEIFSYLLHYEATDAHQRAGLIRFNRLPKGVLWAVRGALDEVSRPVTHPVSLELH